MNDHHRAALEQVEAALQSQGGTDRKYFAALVRSLGFQFQTGTLRKLWNIYEDRVYRAPGQMGLRRTRPVLATASPVMSAAGHPCIYCGKPAAHIDHVWPRVRGGDDHPNNLVRSCKSCNSRKGQRSILTDHCPSCGARRDPSDVVTATGHAYYACRCGASWSRQWDLQSPRLT